MDASSLWVITLTSKPTSLLACVVINIAKRSLERFGTQLPKLSNRHSPNRVESELLIGSVNKR